MIINERVKEILSDYKINQNDGLTYLIALYYGYEASYVPDLLKKKIFLTKIIEMDVNSVITWKIPLFYEQETNYEWVEGYRDTFKKINKDRAGSLKTCVARFKRFFRDNPGVTLDEIKGAVNMYLKTVTNPDYLITSHYFIYKDKGADEISHLQIWLERYRENQGVSVGRNSKSNTMQ